MSRGWKKVSGLPDNKQTCAIYCRVARDDEPGGQSEIERQRRVITEYAQSMGYTVTDVYADNGCSGLDPKRPEYQRLCADIAAGKVETVLTKDPARIWRDSARCAEWFGRMDKRGVTVLCRDAPGFQKALADTHAEYAKLHERKKRKHERHTVRTPPPPAKAR